jgi:hypothetical protein
MAIAGRKAFGIGSLQNAPTDDAVFYYTVQFSEE